MTIQSLIAGLKPEETVLLLGAGASVPSGGLTGQGLSKLLCDALSQGSIDSDDLAEASSLLEARYGRPALVASLASHINSLRPDGGLLSLCTLPWARAYTTNYDQLVEEACRQIGRACRVVKTNRDFNKLDSGEFELLKIHGCISQDRALGHSDSMILTESDYDRYSEYREALFAKLLFDLHTKDVLIVGQSLKDRHLRDLVDLVANRAAKQGTANRVRILVYGADPGRIRLLEERNLRAASGSLAELTEALQSATADSVALSRGGGFRTKNLPRVLLNRTTDVAAATAKEANGGRLFNGASATYGDIAGGLTFERLIEPAAVDDLVSGKVQYLTLVGAAGVGKTTAARRIMAAISASGHPAFEHIDEFPLNWEAWFGVARSAQASGQRVYLLVDDAFRHVTGINRLASHLADESIDALAVVLCAHTASWDPRSKTGLLRKFGREERISILEGIEIPRLVDVIRSNPEVSALLEPATALMSRSEQIDLVKNKATANMFVALKYLFASESIDAIVLEEYASLNEDVQEVYKVAALLEATYAHASRQMILEVLDLDWADIPLVLDRTRGVLTQAVVDSRDGVYVWRTRHPVIAQVIARYKYHDQDELYYVLRKIVRTLNSSMLLDRYIVPNLCDNDWAIGRLTDIHRQIELYELLCARSTNRVPWHRLINAWLTLGDLGAADAVIRRAMSSVGIDSPIARYEIRLKLEKAQDLKKLGTTDYVALILDAESLARESVTRWPDNKYSYLSLSDVGEALFKATGNARLLEEAVDEMRSAYDKILDDQLLRWAQRAESIRS